MMGLKQRGSYDTEWDYLQKRQISTPRRCPDMMRHITLILASSSWELFRKPSNSTCLLVEKTSKDVALMAKRVLPL